MDPTNIMQFTGPPTNGAGRSARILQLRSSLLFIARLREFHPTFRLSHYRRAEPGESKQSTRRAGPMPTPSEVQPSSLEEELSHSGPDVRLQKDELSLCRSTTLFIEG
jgi:hypothetical protein